LIFSDLVVSFYERYWFLFDESLIKKGSAKENVGAL